MEVDEAKTGRLDQLLRAGRIGDDLIVRVAHEIAAFHERAAPVPDEPQGAVAAVRELVELEVGVTLPPEAARAERQQRAFLDRHGTRFERRTREQRVRDVHGELGLEHVRVAEDGSVALLDRAAPGTRMRRIDVCADIALLADELAAEGRVDLAERFLSAYAEHANDFDLFGLVDFYAGLRASLRAKLELVRAERASSAATAREHRRRSHRFVTLALAVRRKALLPPIVIATGGQVASGKSTLARALAWEIGAPVVSSDRTRDFLLGERVVDEPHEIHWERAYEPGFAERVYGEVMRRGEVVLESGRPLVVDGCFRSRAQRAMARALADARGLPFRFVEARIPEPLQRERLHERSLRDAVPDRAWRDIADALRREWEPADELADEQHIVLDTSQPLARNVATLRAKLPTWPPGLTG